MKTPISLVTLLLLLCTTPRMANGWILFLDGTTVPESPNWQSFTDTQPDSTAVVDFLDPVGGTNNQAMRITTDIGANEWFVGPLFTYENAAGARLRLTEFSPTGKENLLCVTTHSTLAGPSPSITLVDGRYKLWSYVDSDSEIMDLGPVVSNQWHTAYLWARNDGKTKLWWDEKLVFDGDAPLVNSYDGYMEWGCGSWEFDASETADFDWVGWGTAADLPIGVVTLPANGTSFYNAAAGFEFTATSFNGIASNAFAVTIDGANRTAALMLTGTETNWHGSIGGLFTNRFYHVVLTMTDKAANTSTYTIDFDTLSQNNFHIEAEDWNFTSGMYLDSVVLSSVPAVDNYVERVGTADIDEADPDPDPAIFEHLYRSASPVATETTGDMQRQAYVDAQLIDPGIADYTVRFVATGEWLNYTRTFPEGKYFIYGRLASEKPEAFEATVAKVTGATTANQTLSLLGSFKGAIGHGKKEYAFIPLTDSRSNRVVVALKGVETLRVTATGTNLANFYMLVPAPLLDIAIVGPQAILSWQSNLDGFKLEATESLLPATWAEVPGPVSVVNGRNTMTNSVSGQAKFYRLKP